MKFALTSDIFTKTKRSEVMSRIRGRGNRTTELAMVKLSRRHGITVGVVTSPCSENPISFSTKKARTVRVTVSSMIAQDLVTELKATGNSGGENSIKTGSEISRLSMELKRSGWKVVRFWEHQLADASRIVKKVKMVLKS